MSLQSTEICCPILIFFPEKIHCESLSRNQRSLVLIGLQIQISTMIINLIIANIYKHFLIHKLKEKKLKWERVFCRLAEVGLVLINQGLTKVLKSMPFVKTPMSLNGALIGWGNGCVGRGQQWQQWWPHVTMTSWSCILHLRVRMHCYWPIQYTLIYVE